MEGFEKSDAERIGDAFGMALSELRAARQHCETADWFIDNLDMKSLAVVATFRKAINDAYSQMDESCKAAAKVFGGKG